MYIDRDLDRKHVEAIIKVEEIKKRMGWELGITSRTVPIAEYQALIEAEEEAEKTRQSLVDRAIQVESRRSGFSLTSV